MGRQCDLYLLCPEPTDNSCRRKLIGARGVVDHFYFAPRMIVPGGWTGQNQICVLSVSRSFTGFSRRAGYRFTRTFALLRPSMEFPRDWAWYALACMLVASLPCCLAIGRYRCAGDFGLLVQPIETLDCCRVILPDTCGCDGRSWLAGSDGDHTLRAGFVMTLKIYILTH